LGESATFESPFIGSLRESIPSLNAMACRLLCASNLAYAPPPLKASPYYENAVNQLYYTKAGFIDRPTVLEALQAGGKIDALLLGTLEVPTTAMAPSQRSVVLACRGTISVVNVFANVHMPSLADWVNDTEAALVPFLGIPLIRVHKGFGDSVRSFFGPERLPELLGAIKDRLKDNSGARFYITGHSKGGAMAYHCALLLQRIYGIPVAGVITFEAPRPGDTDFVKAYKAAGIPSLRYEFQNDIVPHLPPIGRFAEGLNTVLKLPLAAAALRVLYPRALPTLNYASPGRLQFIPWSDRKEDIVEDSTKLEKERIDKLISIIRGAVVKAPGLLQTLGVMGATASVAVEIYKQILSHHFAGCGSGLWRAICKMEKTEVCP
jgi:hypothetical protein